LIATFAGVLSMATAAAAEASDLAGFDAARTNSTAEKIVLCDTSAFLRTRPDLQADRIYARREGRPFQLLLGPYYVQGGFLYSERYERLAEKLERQHRVSARQIADVQASQGRAFVDAWGRDGALPGDFAARQSQVCTAFARDNGVLVAE
jgi:hypothetical protein